MSMHPSHLPPPQLPPPAAWHGICYLFDGLDERYSVTLEQPAPATRLLTPVQDRGPDIDGYHDQSGDDLRYDTWLLCGSPVRVQGESKWTAIYCLESSDA